MHKVYCRNCNWEGTEDKLEELYGGSHYLGEGCPNCKSLGWVVLPKMSDLTCYHCKDGLFGPCPYGSDLYNTEGDCLWIK